MAKDKTPGKLITNNRKARFNYAIEETFEAGIELQGTEVKSLREGRVNLQDAYAIVQKNEIWLINAHISPYQASSQYFNHEPKRSRKLLLHRGEISKLIGKLEQQGLTLVPLKMYFKGNWVKVTLGLGRGKKLYDKRETIKRRQDDREISRAMKLN